MVIDFSIPFLLNFQLVALLQAPKRRMVLALETVVNLGLFFTDWLVVRLDAVKNWIALDAFNLNFL